MKVEATCPECGSESVEKQTSNVPNAAKLTCDECGFSEHFAGDR